MLTGLKHVQDPGNLEADLQAGGFAGYALLWLFLVCTIMVSCKAEGFKHKLVPVHHSDFSSSSTRRRHIQHSATSCLVRGVYLLHVAFHSS